ncbi:MAG: M20/M25/M40 family metallo-hydrolase [Bacillota bacterium]
MDRKRIFDVLTTEFDRDLNWVRDFLKQPSISYTGEGITETAGMVKAWIEELGGTAELVKVPGGFHPVVYGKIDVGAPHTLMIYGMYDVMPADEPGWVSPPFAAEIRDWDGLGPCVINRGAVNSKGPLAGFFASLRAIKQVEGQLPLNFQFVIEGEEEYGSRSLPKFFEMRLDELKKCEAVLFPFFGCDKQGMSGIRLGTKGLLYFELTCRGGDWGGPVERGVHGSNNVWVASPVWRLVNALSTMVDKDQRITVDGLMDDVRKPTAEDIELCEALAKSPDAGRELEANNARKFKWDLRGTDLYLQAQTQPQLNIDGIFGGYTGPGTKTLLPHEVTVKMDVRMVPNMDPDKVVAAIRNHLDKRGYSDIQMKVINKYPWSKVSVKEPIVQALLGACKELGNEPAVYPLNIGSAPFYLFDRVLGIPYVFGGLGHGSRQHSSNEYFVVKGLLEFEKSMVLTIANYLEAVSL